MATGRIQPGQRVWVADPSVPNGRAFGRVVNVDKPDYLGDGGGFIVRLDVGNVVDTCAAAGRGVQWDFADGP